MVAPSIANGFIAAVSALRSLERVEGVFPHHYAPGGPLCVVPGRKPGQGHA
jgi:hypothetical protein